jgi:hypothetical protein
MLHERGQEREDSFTRPALLGWVESVSVEQHDAPVLVGQLDHVRVRATSDVPKHGRRRRAGLHAASPRALVLDVLDTLRASANATKSRGSYTTSLLLNLMNGGPHPSTRHRSSVCVAAPRNAAAAGLRK